MEKRRHLRLVVTAEFLRQAAGLADDTEVLAVRHAPFLDSIEILVTNPGLASVPEGTMAPQLILGSWKGKV